MREQQVKTNQSDSVMFSSKHKGPAQVWRQSEVQDGQKMSPSKDMFPASAGIYCKAFVGFVTD